MRSSSREESPKARPTWETLETWVPGKVQEFVQELLEVEVTEMLGQRHERRAGVTRRSGIATGTGRRGAWRCRRGRSCCAARGYAGWTSF